MVLQWIGYWLHCCKTARFALIGKPKELSDFLNSLKASLFARLKPIGNAVATGAQLADRSASAFGLSDLQQKEHVEAALDLGARALCEQAL